MIYFWHTDAGWFFGKEALQKAAQGPFRNYAVMHDAWAVLVAKKA